MKIFITGCNGKVGQNLSSHLINKNYFCILNSRKKINIRGIKKNFKYYKADILEKNFYIPECEVIIHTAAITPENNKEKISVNKLIDKKIFNLIKKSKKIRKIIFFSTASIYHQNNYCRKVDENSKILSKSQYSSLKLNSEKLYLQNKYIKVYNIRLPGLLLTHQENNFVSNLVKNIKKIKRTNIYNPKQNFNNLLLITSLNFFIENLIKKNFNSGNILLGSSQPIKLIHITKIIADYFRVKSYINWKINKKRGFYLNINRAIKKYNFKPLSTKKSILDYLKKNYPKNVK